METVFGIVFLISLFGNWHQAAETREAKAEALKWQTVAQETQTAADANAEAARNAAEAARANEDIIVGIVESVGECREKLREYEGIIADFEPARVEREAEAADLAGRFADSGHDVCVVPRWLANEIAGSGDGADGRD